MDVDSGRARNCCRSFSWHEAAMSETAPELLSAVSLTVIHKP